MKSGNSVQSDQNRHKGFNTFWLPLLTVTVLIFSSFLFAAEPEFFIRSASLEKNNDGWQLSAQIDYRFSEPTIEALNNGVPLYISTRLKVDQPKRWFWSKTVLEKEIRTRLRYLALSKLYQVTDLEDGKHHNFASFQAAIDHLGSPKKTLSQQEADSIKPDSTKAKLKTKLEIESLPLPLRPVAYLKPAWHLNSGWHTWKLAD